MKKLRERRFITIPNGRRCSSGYLAGLAALLLTTPFCHAQVAAPPQASAVGYNTNTFSTTAFTTSTVDTVDKGSTYPAGYQWYPAKFWGTPNATDAASMALGAGNVITLNSDGTAAGNPNAQISTICADTSKLAGFTGTAFGGGAYFEATLAFNPTDVFNSPKGWPSWWTDPEEHLSSAHALGNFWYYYDPAYFATNPNYAHFTEYDFFEYNVATQSKPLVYGGDMNEWYGDYGTKGPYLNIQSSWADKQMGVPAGTLFTAYHKYGFLWVPATSTADGYAEFYFDGNLVGPAGAQKVSWAQYQADSPPPTGTSWIYGIGDQEHMALILGSGQATPMTVQSVNVWQASPNWNISTSTLYDPLYDLSKTYSSSNMGFDKTSPDSFQGDGCRSARTTLSNGTLVYNLANITKFTARVFAYNNTTNTTTFAVSSDDVHWTSVPISSLGKKASINGWNYQDWSNSGTIASGMNYLQVTVSGSADHAWDQEISMIRIN